MRYLLLLAAALAISACATAPEIERARMPLNILRAEGEAPRMGAVRLEAGSYAEKSSFSFGMTFAVDGQSLGKPTHVGWTSQFGDYCRNHATWVQTLLIGPDGREWRGQTVFVPPGPDRGQDWSTGSTGSTGPDAVATPGLLEAATMGGLFTVVLEDDQGQRWTQGVFDTLTPIERQRLFAENLKTFMAVDQTDTPVRSDMLIAVQRAPLGLPNPPRPCPDL